MSDQLIDAGGADEIVTAQAADAVCAVADLAAIVMYAEVRMVILLMGYPGHGIDECQGSVIVGEMKIPLQAGRLPGGNRPVRMQLCEQRCDSRPA